jgi:hypothetical protein
MPLLLRTELSPILAAIIVSAFLLFFGGMWWLVTNDVGLS